MIDQEGLEHRDDGLDAVRGVLVGLILSAGIWAGLFYFWAWVS